MMGFTVVFPGVFIKPIRTYRFYQAPSMPRSGREDTLAGGTIVGMGGASFRRKSPLERSVVISPHHWSARNFHPPLTREASLSRFRSPTGPPTCGGLSCFTVRSTKGDHIERHQHRPHEATDRDTACPPGWREAHDVGAATVTAVPNSSLRHRADPARPSGGHDLRPCRCREDVVHTVPCRDRRVWTGSWLSRS